MAQRSRLRLWPGVLAAAGALLLAASLCAEARAGRQAADSHAAGGPPSAARRSPSGQPLLATPAAGEGEEAGRAVHPEADPLVSNGLGSPSCGSSVARELPASSRRDCETSGFIAAAAPTDNYGLDVHIDTGLLPTSGGNLMSTVQNLLVTPEWLGLVWLVHALVVMLEWGFAIDVLETGPASALTSGLAGAQATFTAPLLALTLALAAILTAYRGLVRREIAQTMGDAAMTVAMIAGGLWLMADPAGTVGALSRWSDQAGLGTLAVAAQGSPATPGRALGTDLSGVFAATIEAPWCYLEFGNVRWCREPRELDPALRAAGAKIAASELAQAGCGDSSLACGHGSGGAGLLTSARLLREARTNGELFLALPPDGPARNSINDGGSLLRTLCAASEATSCVGAAAGEAEFRTNSGTWPRVTGLLLISVGLLGMLLLYGYVALRLLTAAVLALFFLLIVPAAVLMPALGERGRALFRLWAGRLFGAVISKLVFAFLLGVLLAVTSVVEDLNGLGWWAQWLLLSAFWWGAFLRRHQLLALPQTAITDARHRVQASRLRVVRETFHTARQTTDWRDRRREKEQIRASGDAERSRRRGERDHFARVAGSPRDSAGSRHPPDAQALRMLHAETAGRGREAAAAAARVALRVPRLERVEGEHGAAGAAGNRRRAARLTVRRDRLAREVAEDQAAISAAGDGPGTPINEPAELQARARFLDLQAELPRAGAPRGAAARRDYRALAGLLGQTRPEYDLLAPGAQRAARLEIDRELALRGSRPPSLAHGEDGASAVSWRGSEPGAQLRSTDPEIVRRRSRPPIPAERNARRSAWPPNGEPSESPVMRDAREVSAGRKRQLGTGRP